MVHPLSLQPPDAAQLLVDDQHDPRWLVIAVIDEVGGMKFHIDTLDDYVQITRISHDKPDESPAAAWQQLLDWHAGGVTLVAVYYSHPHCSHVALLQRLDDWPAPTTAGQSMGFSHLPTDDELRQIADGVSLELSKRRDNDGRARNARNN